MTLGGQALRLVDYADEADGLAKVLFSFRLEMVGDIRSSVFDCQCFSRGKARFGQVT
jgi:hypothetical protein